MNYHRLHSIVHCQNAATIESCRPLVSLRELSNILRVCVYTLHVALCMLGLSNCVNLYQNSESIRRYLLLILYACSYRNLDFSL